MILFYDTAGNRLPYWQSDIEQNEQIDGTRNGNNLFGLAIYAKYTNRKLFYGFYGEEVRDA